MILGYLLWAYVFAVAVVALVKEFKRRSKLTPEELAKEAEEDLQRIPGDW
jgi:hypothetical protein